MTQTPLLMIPGPIEVSPAVQMAAPAAPPSHVSETIRADFGAALRQMRRVWLAGETDQPFAVGGSGTLAMEMAVYNLVEPGDAVVVINTGYFSARMRDMLRRAGAEVRFLGEAPQRPISADALEQVLSQERYRAVFVTHVDTSTGIRVSPEPYCRVAAKWDVLTVFDGVCATAAERFEMSDWGADVYLTASQKAIGLPAGLGLMVVSAKAMQRRRSNPRHPPLVLDWLQWAPVMEAYEAERGAYFSTPPTTLLSPLRVALDELVPNPQDPMGSMNAVFERHRRSAEGLRKIWGLWGLSLLAPSEDCAANTLSTLRYPEGVGPELLTEIRHRGVIIAGGLFPGLAQQTFRIGHMGYAVTRSDWMVRMITAVGEGLCALRHSVDIDAALALWDAHVD